MTKATAPASASIVCEQLTKVYGDGTRALHSLDLQVEPGHVLALVGPSGCGKTSLLRMIAGLEQITAGRLFIDGRLANNLRPRERNIAMVFQNYALYPHMNVFDNMAFPLRVRRTARGEIRRRVEEAAEVLGLTALLKKRAGQLSGGQRQRVAMGRAMVRAPGIFLMDEPLSNLDAQLRVSMRMEIARLQRRLGVTTVYVTHDQTEAMVLGDRIAVLKDGALQQYGTPEDVYHRPATVFVARFIGSPSMNVIEVTVEDAHGDAVVTYGENRLRFSSIRSGVRPRLPPGPAKLLCGIRPESLHEVRDEGRDDRRPRLRGIVELREQLGSEVLLHINIPRAPAALGGYVDDPGAADHASIDPSGLIVARVDPQSHAREGAEVTLEVELAGMHFFDPATEQRLEAS